MSDQPVSADDIINLAINKALKAIEADDHQAAANFSQVVIALSLANLASIHQAFNNNTATFMKHVVTSQGIVIPKITGVGRG